MRILFSTTGGAGHFGPLVPVARACRAAGHDVVVAAPASFADSVARAGLPFAAFADAPAAQMAAVFGRLPSLPREDADLIVIREVFAGLDAQAALPGLTQLVESWRPDLLVREPAEFGSLVVAARTELPQAQVAIGLNQVGIHLAEVAEQPLRALAESVGLAGPDVAALMLGTLTLTAVPVGLDQAADDPGSVRGPVRRFRPPGSSIAAELPSSWGDPAWPLVYVTFGSVTAGSTPFSGVYRAALDALADLPVRVLMTTGSGLTVESLGPLPGNAHVLSWWPQEAVMPYASLVVGHGGFGTTMSAVAAGVPQVTVPLFSFDQFINAASVEAAGAGVQLLDDLPDLRGLPGAVERVLGDPAYADRARGLAAEVAALPEVADVVPVLEGLVVERAVSPAGTSSVPSDGSAGC